MEHCDVDLLYITVWFMINVKNKLSHMMGVDVEYTDGTLIRNRLYALIVETVTIVYVLNVCVT
jgi:hypothetical protein